MASNVLVFKSSASLGLGDELLDSLENALPRKCKLEIYDTMRDLVRRLRQPRDGLDIAVLFVASKDELIQIHLIRDLFAGMRLILILPDQRSETLSAGLVFRPRFMTYVDQNLSEVASVVRKMLAPPRPARTMSGKPGKR